MFFRRLPSAGVLQFGMFAIQQAVTSTTLVGKKAVTTTATKWGFYDAPLNLQATTTEMVPLLNIPMQFRIESGPAVKLSKNGNTLFAQSAALADVTFNWIGGWPITVGGGVINCSAISGVMPAVYLNLTHQF
jgi:hypothetical protein